MSRYPMVCWRCGHGHPPAGHARVVAAADPQRHRLPHVAGWLRWSGASGTWRGDARRAADRCAPAATGSTTGRCRPRSTVRYRYRIGWPTWPPAPWSTRWQPPAPLLSPGDRYAARRPARFAVTRGL